MRHCDRDDWSKQWIFLQQRSHWPERGKQDYQSQYRKGSIIELLLLHYPVGYALVFIIHEKQWLLAAFQVGTSVIAAEQ